MNKILVIGSGSHEQADSIAWTQPFCDFEKYDCLIIDLSSFPRDYPRTLFKNIGILKRVSRLFTRDTKEIFCIMEKPFKVLFKNIPLNYSWMPFPQKLTVNPMLLGKTINVTDKRFADYLGNVERWYNELFWQNTDNISFEVIASNKSQNAVAATVMMGNRGKIHFLPKTTRISQPEAIKLLIGLVAKKEETEHSGLNNTEIPELGKKLDAVSMAAFEQFHNLFSLDDKQLTQAVYLVLEDLGITATPTEFNIASMENSIPVKVISTEGKVEAQNAEINRIAQLIENKRKIIIVANTYKELPIKNRANKQHLDIVMKLFFETNNTTFLTTLSLYNLWKKVTAGQVSVREASSVIQNQSGEITI